jgi:flavin-dependent dehydrogenase
MKSEARMNEIRIAGGGPAGGAAAIAALRENAAVHIVERSRAPRHKVCGEFISAEACRVLNGLGLWPEFSLLHPPLIGRCLLHLGRSTKSWNFREPGFGLSRRALDRLVLERAVAQGARLSRGERYQDALDGGESTVLSSGRRGNPAKGRRLFGFKAHFAGPVSDAVELFFTRFGYVGVSPVEDDLTNVCGIAPEDELRACQFEIDEFLAGEPALAGRLRPMSRIMPWLTTGPLKLTRGVSSGTCREFQYPAGDALGFIDPFTGSGILNALLTGSLAGRAAARGMPVDAYLRKCAMELDGPFAVSALFRTLWRAGMSHLALFVPGDWLYRVTRVHALDVIDA